MFLQITWFYDGKVDFYPDETTYSFEACESRRSERTYEWDTRGDHTFVRAVKYLCISKRRTTIP